jgi:hypothetical protein
MWSQAEIKKGKCTDCLACELACQLQGLGGVTVSYAIPKLDGYLEEIEKKGIQPVYSRQE